MNPLPSPLYPHHSPKGFTLMEILIGLTILISISLIGIYSSLGVIQKQRLISAADTISTHLENSKTLSISTTNNQYWAVSFTSGATPSITQYCFSCPAGQQQPKVYRLPKQVSFGTLPPGNIIIFEKFSGRALGPLTTTLKTSNTIIPLTAPNWSINIVIPPHGTIYVETIVKT